jgi:hypothetical protein
MDIKICHQLYEFNVYLFSLCTTEWLRMERLDIVDNVLRVLRIGKNTYGKLFVQFIVGRDLKR